MAVHTGDEQKDDHWNIQIPFGIIVWLFHGNGFIPFSFHIYTWIERHTCGIIDIASLPIILKMLG